MLKLFKNLEKKDWLFIFISCIFIVLQVWLELKIPDYMSRITELVQLNGTIKEILTEGSYMLGCALLSFASSVVVGYIIANLASNFSKNLREKLFNKVQSFSMEEIKKFAEENKKLIEEKNALSDKILRLNAEMQNMNRRFNEEKANIYKYDGEKLIKEILPIIDNFERAISLDDDNLTDELSKFLSGFKMIYTSLLSTLNAIGVKEIEAMGKQFDPKTMEAIMTTSIMEEEEGVVVEVMQKGYTYNDKVIRVAMVKVNE